MSMPPGPPIVPSDDNIDPDRRSDDVDEVDEVDDDEAAAEALGYADPEEAPLRTHDDTEGGDRPDGGSADDRS